MATTSDAAPFHVLERGGQQVLFEGHESVELERMLLAELEQLPSGAILPVDLGGVRLSSEAARQLLMRAVRRVAGGELADRFIVLTNLKTSAYNVEAMLLTEGITMIERMPAGEAGHLIGQVDPAVQATYEFLCSRKTATARDVFEHFKLSNISTATNRLSALTARALAAKIGIESAEGGGRQFRYGPVQ